MYPEILQEITVSLEIDQNHEEGRIAVIVTGSVAKPKNFINMCIYDLYWYDLFNIACAVPQPKIFYPFFVLIFYVLSVIPMMLAKRLSPGSETNPKTEFALFLTSGMVLSSFALPIILYIQSYSLESCEPLAQFSSTLSYPEHLGIPNLKAFDCKSSRNSNDGNCLFIFDTTDESIVAV
uniref:Uncharacterized protein n=1 Tax=Glossina palpalis gambiensis TaxID=67801 RepID=A0A1B0BP31_9MUSC